MLAEKGLRQRETDRRNMKLLALSVLIGCISVYSQQADFYLITGRVSEENGTAIPNAGICLEPTVPKQQGFDRLIECVGSSKDGTFQIRKPKTELTKGTQYSLFVYSDPTPDALAVVRPPYDGLRTVEPWFEGIPLRLDSDALVNLSDVRVKFRYGTTFLKPVGEKASSVNWLKTFLQVRTEHGNVAHSSTLSVKNVRRYVTKAGLMVSLPVGNWKVELIDMDTDTKIAESELFSITVGPNKPVLIRSAVDSEASNK